MLVYMKLRISSLTFMLDNTQSQQMETNFGRFKMLALQTLAGEELKNDVNNAMLFFKSSSMTFCICVGLYDRNHHCQI